MRNPRSETWRAQGRMPQLRVLLLLAWGALNDAAYLAACSLERHSRFHERRCLPCRCCSTDDAAADDANLDATLAWRVERARLEQQRSREVLKRRPRFLPFTGARQWARAMFFTSEADWRDWIDAGEKRNPYIPCEPDKIYADAGWQGWDGECCRIQSRNPSSLEP
jgi:hypothetical protein